jgi:hypothetical protein
VRRSGLPFAIAILAITAGCVAPDYSVGPEQLPPLPRGTVLFDCQLSPEQCAIIEAGIEYLLSHANPMCRLVGSSARNRYDAASGEGYRNRPTEPPPDDQLDTSVYSNPIYPSDGYTNV